MPAWKKVNISFKTIKLGDFIEPVKTTVSAIKDSAYNTVYGVTNTEGITITGKAASADISKYIIIDKNFFAYNPYRINVGSLGLNDKGLKGCVSPAYVVFKTKDNIDPTFLFSYLKSDFGNHLINWYGNRGGVRNALRYADLAKIDLPAISYKKQKRVVIEFGRVSRFLEQYNAELTSELLLLKQLSQAVLREAVEGKLTADWRKKNFELIRGEMHASVLLDKIKSEKTCLIKEGKIKKGKPLKPIKEEEKFFELPEGWAWCRLGEICDFITKGTTPPTHELKTSGDIPYLKVYNIVNQKIDFDYRSQFISNKTHQNKLNRSKVYPGDVLMNIVGPPLGKVAIVPDMYPEWNINQALAIFRPLVKTINKFLYLYLLGGFEIEKIHTLGVVGQDNISLEQCRNILFPVLPLAEQQIIVERADKLMSMIAALEKQVYERKEQGELLMQSVLREAFENS